MVNKENFRKGLSAIVSGLTGSPIDVCYSVVNGVFDKGKEIVEDIQIRIGKKDEIDNKSETKEEEKVN